MKCMSFRPRLESDIAAKGSHIDKFDVFWVLIYRHFTKVILFHFKFRFYGYLNIMKQNVTELRQRLADIIKMPQFFLRRLHSHYFFVTICLHFQGILIIVLSIFKVF